MQEFDIRVHSAASAPTLYALLTVGASWPKWSPIGSFEPEGDGGTPEGPQSVGDVRVFRTGRHVSRERVVELVPDERLGYELVGDGPLRDYRSNVDLTPDPAGGTHIRWHSAFHARPGVGLFWRLFLRRFVGRCAEGLAKYAAEQDAGPGKAASPENPEAR